MLFRSAKAEEARANVIQAEAEVPKAMAEAFRSGNLGIMDYYRAVYAYVYQTSSTGLLRYD